MHQPDPLPCKTCPPNNTFSSSGEGQGLEGLFNHRHHPISMLLHPHDRSVVGDCVGWIYRRRKAYIRILTPQCGGLDRKLEPDMEVKFYWAGSAHPAYSHDALLASPIKFSYLFITRTVHINMTSQNMLLAKRLVFICSPRPDVQSAT